MTVGILSVGHYVPPLRLDLDTLQSQWGLPDALARAYRLNGRQTFAVPAADEDTVTLAIEAGQRACDAATQTQGRRSLLVGSESHPYAVKPTAAIVADALGWGPDVFTSDLQFACKGGTAALAASWGMVASGQVATALAIGADCPQSAPGSILEASVGAAASALLLGTGPHVIATLEHFASSSSDTSDFWRRDGQPHPSVVGKFGAEVYARHTARVCRALLEQSGTTPEDYRFLCLHQPYASLPLAVAKEVGFRPRQVRPGLVAGRIGNAYASATLLSLCAVLDRADPGDRILMVSFGSGAGSDGFILTATEALPSFRARAAALGHPTVAAAVEPPGTSLPYGQYAWHQGKLAR